MATMTDGKLKVALKKAVLKLRDSREGEEFAFYMLLHVKTREAILFVDAIPGRSPRRFCKPELIDRHLKKTRLLKEGLGADLKPLRSCAGVVRIKKGSFYFDVTSRAGKATASMLRLALFKDPTIKKIVRPCFFGTPEQPGAREEQDRKIRGAIWKKRDGMWAKRREDARTHSGREGSSSRSEEDIKALYRLLVINIEQIGRDLQALDDDIEYLTDQNAPGRVAALEDYRDRMSGHRREFIRWKGEVSSAAKTVTVKAEEIEALTLDDLEQERLEAIELRTLELLEDDWAVFGDGRNDPEGKAALFKDPELRELRQEQARREIREAYRDALSVELDAAFDALELEEEFLLQEEETLTIEVDDLLAEIGNRKPPEASRRRLLQLGSAAFRGDDPARHLKKLKSAISDPPTIKQLDVLIHDAARCRESTSLPPSEGLYSAISDFVHAQETPSAFIQRIPRLCYLFRGGKHAALAAGALSHAIRLKDSRAIFLLKESYQGIGAEVADFEQGVSLLISSGYVSSQLQLYREHLTGSGEFGPMLSGLLALYAAVNPPIEPKGKVVALKTIDAIEQGVELYSRASEALSVLQEWAEWLESPEYRKDVSVEYGWRASWTSEVFERAVDYADLSAKADLQLTTEAAARCSASGSFTITGSRIRLDGEVKLGAVAEASIQSHPSLSYKGKQLFSADLVASASIGAGVSASGSITFRDGRFRIRLRGSGTFGVGVGTGSEVEIDYRALGEAMLEKEFYTQTMGAIGAALKSVLTWVFEQLKKLYAAATVENITALPGGTFKALFPKMSEAHSFSEAMDRAMKSRAHRPDHTGGMRKAASH